MKLCEYIHNITDILYIEKLIFNKSIKIQNYLNEHYDVYLLLDVDIIYGWDVDTRMRVSTINTKYSYLSLSSNKTYQYIGYVTTEKINTLKYIQLKFR